MNADDMKSANRDRYRGVMKATTNISGSRSMKKSDLYVYTKKGAFKRWYEAHLVGGDHSASL